MEAKDGSLTQAAVQFMTDFAKYGLGMFFLILLSSSLAGFVIFLEFPNQEYAFILSLIVSSLYISTIYVRALQDKKESHDAGSMVHNIKQLFYNMVQSPIKIIILSSYFSFLLFSITYIWIGILEFNLTILGLLLIAYYPVVDFESFRRKNYSPGAVPAILLLKVFKRLGIVKDSMTIDEIFVINPPPHQKV